MARVSIDDKLLDHAFAVSGERSRKAVITRALEEFITRRQNKHIADLLGKLQWDAFDYKAERSRP